MQMNRKQMQILTKVTFQQASLKMHKSDHTSEDSCVNSAVFVRLLSQPGLTCSALSDCEARTVCTIILRDVQIVPEWPDKLDGSQRPAAGSQ